jgi:hypothetical protein
MKSVGWRSRRDARLYAQHPLSTLIGSARKEGSDMKRLVLIATLLSNPASAQFYSYNDFERQPPPVKYFYVAGEIDMFLAIQASGAKRFEVGECIRDSKISIKEITENMQAYARIHPELQNGSVATPLLGYLAELCPASKD